MDTTDLMKADHRVLSGLILKVWSTDVREQADPLARENAEAFIRMYMEETMRLHITHEPGGNGADSSMELK